jgi:hypothetical protein
MVAMHGCCYLSFAVEIAISAAISFEMPREIVVLEYRR